MSSFPEIIKFNKRETEICLIYCGIHFCMNRQIQFYEEIINYVVTRQKPSTIFNVKLNQ